MRRVRKAGILYCVFVAVMAALFGCGGGDGGSKEAASTVAEEQWSGTTLNGNSAKITLSKSSDGTITSSGSLSSLFDKVTCPFSSAPVTISGTTISFTTSGTATKEESSGQITSPFTLRMDADMIYGQTRNGSFTLSFSAAGWPSSVSGSWSAKKLSGSGITSDDSGSDNSTSLNLAGTWRVDRSFDLSSKQESSPGFCSSPDESSFTSTVTQNGTIVSFTDEIGAVRQGTLSNNILTSLWSKTSNGGVSNISMTEQFSSSSQGSGTSSFSWSNGSGYCKGTYNLSFTKQ